MARILIDKDIPVPMRDGARLAADVYRLDGVPTAPVLLARTPYDKERGAVSTGVPFDILRAVQAGDAVVLHDVRGRFASEGGFGAQFQEDADGALSICVDLLPQRHSKLVSGRPRDCRPEDRSRSRC